MKLLDDKMKETIIRSLIKHAEGHIEKHCANVEVYLNNYLSINFKILEYFLNKISLCK